MKKEKELLGDKKIQILESITLEPYTTKDNFGVWSYEVREEGIFSIQQSGIESDVISWEFLGIKDKEITVQDAIDSFEIFVRESSEDSVSICCENGFDLVILLK